MFANLPQERTLKQIRMERDIVGQKLTNGILSGVPAQDRMGVKVKERIDSALKSDPTWAALNNELQEAKKALVAKTELDNILASTL